MPREHVTICDPEAVGPDNVSSYEQEITAEEHAAHDPVTPEQRERHRLVTGAAERMRERARADGPGSFAHDLMLILGDTDVSGPAST